MLSLKPYQQDCLDALAAYLKRVDSLHSNDAPRTAFIEQTTRNYHPIPQLPGLPYVCLRVPTGGGKTVLAAHAVGIATRALLRQERSLVLWLAPTNTIVEQTLRALKDRRHPYREALDKDFGGSVSVLAISEALYVQRGTLDSDTVVIVCTFASLRVTETEGRKIYEANGNLMAHFTGLTARQIEELQAGGETDPALIAPSLANLIRLRHPIVIMDEAHNARTPLTFDTLQRFAPSCIIELTATPDQEPPTPSNILYHCSAAQLKADGMIKLPVKLKDRPQWKEAVQAALAKQKELEATAQKEEALTGEYIRPVVLFQAQNESKTQENITAERLVQSLVEDFAIPRDQIAIATGKTDELAGQTILDRKCGLRFVVTVQKLKEGWDCPFAYVLCSVTNLSSSTAVEQILGRILRLPSAVTKQHASLNVAYAYATSQNLLDAARGLSDAIVEAGFTSFEAKQMIRPEDEEEGALFARFTEEPLAEKVQEVPDLTVLPLEVAAKVKLDEGKKVLTWTAPKAMTEPEKKALQAAVKSEVDKIAVEKLYRKSRGMETSPSAMGTRFQVPVLAIKSDEQYELFEDQFNEGEWHLSKCDAVLTEKEFALPTGGNRSAVLDVNEKGKLTTSFIEDIQRQLEMFEQGPKDAVALTSWLARYVKAVDVTHEEKSLFLHAMIKAAIDLRGFTIEQLLSARFRLVDSAINKIDAHRRDARSKEYQRFLSPEFATPIEVTPAKVFQYPRGVYPANQYYEGRYRFDKHYYEKPADMNGEEADCAALIDGNSKVKHWVRNLVRDNYAFALRLPNGYFFPDFVAELTDGRYLVVEYKGQQEEDRALTAMKEVVGKLWQGRSKGLCVFFIATKENMRSQLDSLA